MRYVSSLKWLDMYLDICYVRITIVRSCSRPLGAHMTTKLQELRLPARFAQASVLLDEAPLGHLMALVLHKLDRLGKNGYGQKVLEELSIDSGVWIDHVQIYSTIRKLVDRKLITLA